MLNGIYVNATWEIQDYSKMKAYILYLHNFSHPEAIVHMQILVLDELSIVR